MMSKTLTKKLKIGLLGLLSVGVLAACNTTDDYEEDPEMGPETEEPVDGEVELEEDPS